LLKKAALTLITRIISASCLLRASTAIYAPRPNTKIKRLIAACSKRKDIPK
jgi:hypothetical protein